MSLNFDAIPARRGTDSIKWNKHEGDVLPLWVADMDFLSPSPVIKALQKRIEHGVFGYPQPPKKLKEVVVDWLYKQYAWELDPIEILLIPGVVPGFNLAAHAFADPGQGVLIQTPCYGPFLKVAENAGLIQQEMELIRQENGTYSVDSQVFESTVTNLTRIFMLCNPQNPTGRVFRKDELERMAEICLRHGIIICSDEIHADLVYSGQKHIPIASLDPQIAQNTITLMAPSKTFNTPGLKASFAVIPNPELRLKFEAAKQGLVGWLNILGQTAMQAAYQEGEAWLKTLLTYLEENRNYTYEFVNNELPGVQMSEPEGTFLAWLDCRSANIEDEPSQFFIMRARVALNEGEWFGKGGEGFVRLNFGCPRSILIEALDRMKRSLRQHYS